MSLENGATAVAKDMDPSLRWGDGNGSYLVLLDHYCIVQAIQNDVEG